MNLANCLSVYLCAKNHTLVQCIKIHSKYHAKSMISQTGGSIFFFFSTENSSAVIDRIK